MSVDAAKIRVIAPDAAAPEDLPDGFSYYRAASDSEFTAANLAIGTPVTVRSRGEQYRAVVRQRWFYDGVVIDVTRPDGEVRSVHPQFGDEITADDGA